ncbi:formate dehydrogenase accessory protein FdhE, partial [Escherichia coli]|uniref:formate dehydrogenase accessory protein FdhE domain-containing protein n=2 Tax=Enterobacterales TaxID=91347 RepID=UPI0019CFC4AC
DNPLIIDLAPLLTQQAGIAPLDKRTFKRSKHWHALLASIIAELRPVVPESVTITLENLSKASETELEEMATALLNDEYSKVSADKSVFIWSALSLYWAQLASNIPGKAKTEYGENRQFCPVCNSMPVTSIVQIGTTQGLR